MSQIHQKIKYLRECYSSDSSGIEVQNVFSRSIEHRMFIEGENDLAFDGNHKIPLNLKIGLEARDASIKYEREKELVYSTVFIVGKNSELSQKWASPLLLFPAKIELVSDVPFLTFETNNFRVNYGLIKRVINDDEKSSILHEKIFEIVQNGIFRAESIGAISDSFIKYAAEIDVSQMIFFPNAVSSVVMRNESAREGLKVLPAGCVALIKRSIERRGILEELSMMSSSKVFSGPVCELLGIPFEAQKKDNAIINLEKIPAVLSDPQKDILNSCSKNIISLVIGPPGTGKSYTIACIALEHMARGKSVLIASRKDHAVDVIGQKIETLSGDKMSVVRGGRKKNLSDLKARLQSILSGMRGRKKAATLEEDGVKQIQDLSYSIKSFESKLAQDEKLFIKQSDQEKKYAFVQTELLKGGFQLLNKIKLYILKRSISKRGKSLCNLMQSIEDLLDSRNQTVVKRIGIRKDARIHKILATNRRTLMDYLKSLRARTGLKQRDLLSKLDIGVILETFPVWMAKNSDIHDNLPNIPELFDLAIIDEASQCDIASCLPILQRAKRIAIVGDPKQLRHVSFLARSKQSILAAKQGLDQSVAELLDYRSKSILDLAGEIITEQERVQFLDEHYRSRPDIIQFSNRKFYNDSIRIMTQNSELVGLKNIQVIQCGGIREKNGINKKESDELIRVICETVESQHGLDSDYSQTIGVTTPFRQQADYLQELILNEMSVESVQKHNILVGTPYSFQGEERDIMLISFVLDQKSSASAMRYMNQSDVFNVMITRARVKQIIFLSTDENQVSPDSLLGSYFLYLRSYYNESQNCSLSQLPKSAELVYDSLIKEGYKVLPSYELAGLEIDFVIQKEVKTIGIDLIGFPGRYEDAFSLERYKMFKRAGMRIFPLAYSEWEKSSKTCLDEIRSFLLCIKNK